MNESQQTIIFFDGVCHLCNGFVDFMIKLDGKSNGEQRRFHFAALQGETASKELSLEIRKSLETVIVKTSSGKVLCHSDAIIYLLEELGGTWKLLSIIKYIPKTVRDLCYRLVARNRYWLFGKRDHCRLAGIDEKKYLLP